GALCADHPEQSKLQALEDYSRYIGLAFQVVDDILDVVSTTEKLGKPSGADQALGKSTYPALMGLQESRKLAQTLYQQAIASISAISDNEPLLDLAALIINREH
ncbi:MAG: polyprenyl synthetase family protein, partial [Arenicella sp.]|nr:polyprenyl synthetase family protein [Arenicella sp.]